MTLKRLIILFFTLSPQLYGAEISVGGTVTSFSESPVGGAPGRGGIFGDEPVVRSSNFTWFYTCDRGPSMDLGQCNPLSWVDVGQNKFVLAGTLTGQPNPVFGGPVAESGWGFAREFPLTIAGRDPQKTYIVAAKQRIASFVPVRNSPLGSWAHFVISCYGSAELPPPDSMPFGRAIVAQDEEVRFQGEGLPAGPLTMEASGRLLPGHCNSGPIMITFDISGTHSLTLDDLQITILEEGSLL